MYLEFLPVTHDLGKVNQMDSSNFAREYPLGRQIGRGGMAEVFDVSGNKHPNTVVKVSLDSHYGGELITEAEVVARLSKTSVDITVEPSGACEVKIAVPRVHGVNFDSSLRGANAYQTKSKAFVAIAKAVHNAHLYGVVLGDIQFKQVLFSENPDDTIEANFVDFNGAEVLPAGEAKESAQLRAKIAQLDEIYKPYLALRDKYVLLNDDSVKKTKSTVVDLDQNVNSLREEVGKKMSGYLRDLCKRMAFRLRGVFDDDLMRQLLSPENIGELKRKIIELVSVDNKRKLDETLMLSEQILEEAHRVFDPILRATEYKISSEQKEELLDELARYFGYSDRGCYHGLGSSIHYNTNTPVEVDVVRGWIRKMSNVLDSYDQRTWTSRSDTTAIEIFDGANTQITRTFWEKTITDWQRLIDQVKIHADEYFGRTINIPAFESLIKQSQKALASGDFKTIRDIDNALWVQSIEAYEQTY